MHKYKAYGEDMKKNVLIIEDNETQLEMLKKIVLEVNSDATVYTASESSAAYKILMEKTIDFFLSDIILNTKNPGDVSGIKLIEKVRTIPKYMFTPVIFITSLEDESGYAYKDLNCLGYIEKPFAPDNVKKLLSKAMNYSTEKERDITLCFRKDGVIFPIKENEIVYIESTNHSLTIYLCNGKKHEMPYRTCKQILEETDSRNLLQCSRNTIVNRQYILNIDLSNRYITLDNNMGKVEIGITYRKSISQEYKG